MASQKSQTQKDQTFEQVFQEIYKEAFTLLIDRQTKYGSANISQLGLYGVISRIANDKTSRILHAMNGSLIAGRVNLKPFESHSDETIEDALLDIANYALIAIALKRGKWGAPLERDVHEADKA